jgi:hypothetical protein
LPTWRLKPHVPLPVDPKPEIEKQNSAEKKRRRLKEKVRLLSDEDLWSVFRLRQSEAKAKAKPKPKPKQDQ